MQMRPLLVLAALAAAAEPDLGRAAALGLKERFKERYGEDPIGTTVASVLLSAWLFYRAERGKNPKVDTYYAALEYVTSSLSVGYTDIYPKTSAGKAIASTLMTFGPAMTGGLLDAASASTPARASSKTDPVVERLDRILAELERRAVVAEVLPP